MKLFKLIILLLVSFSTFGQSNLFNPPVVEAKAITKDFMSYWNYYNQHIQWASDFKTIDTSFSIISKEFFLEELINGNFIPLKLKAKNGDVYYQLSLVPNDADKSILSTLKQAVREALQFYRMEGKELPNFNFSDINGNLFNTTNTKGKIVVLNCWYVTCSMCVKEMPELNKLVKKYKNNPNVIFLGLAMDSPNEIKLFQKSHRFDYALIGSQTDYMKQTLNIIAYPSHIVLNSDGQVVKAFSGVHTDELQNIINQLINT